MAPSILSLTLPDRRARLLRRLALVAGALGFAAKAAPDRDHELKSRLRTASTACQQLVAHIQRQGGAP